MQPHHCCLLVVGRLRRKVTSSRHAHGQVLQTTPFDAATFAACHSCFFQSGPVIH
ncbi:Uncharacterised protein [Vibrio cholerae]|nr:Uncharacterised protein [Vibrio cholerae]CSE04475.1 Uncharacterised protein [Vibrio cholerae]CSI83262.1 Uncharacterised protein [Vibrio cholerae]